MTTKATDETKDNSYGEKTETKKPAKGSIVIVDADWKPTGKTFPKPEGGYLFRFADPDDPGVTYERAGSDAENETVLYKVG